MSKIKLTKGELKKQRDSLKQFQHYLPTLQLKKQQLQITILQARKELEGKNAQWESISKQINLWVGLLGDPGVDISKRIKPTHVATDKVNIAGADLPVLRSVEFHAIDYDFYLMPFWVDRAIEVLRSFVSLLVEMDIIKKKISILEHELRITTQRVNLFEKIKIPECLENIRIIRICLGDQQANAVGISKVAKRKISQTTNMESVAV